MSDVAIELLAHWDELLAGPTAESEWRAKRLRVTGPIASYAAIRNSDGQRAVVFESPIANAPAKHLRFEAEGLRASEKRDFDEGRYRVAASLEQEGYEAIFRIVAVDLLSVVAEPGAAAVRWTRLGQRLAAWQACLKARPRSLGREAQIGLYGELICLQWLAGSVGVLEALAGWRGPVHGLHDFLLDRMAFEVKTATGNDQRIWIGSLDQLEERGRPLVLLRPRLRASSTGRSLAGLVEDLIGKIGIEGRLAVRQFEELLMRCGYIAADASDYAELFELASLSGYPVDDNLPRLKRSSINPAITDAQYQIDEGKLVTIRLEGDRLVELLTECPHDR